MHASSGHQYTVTVHLNVFENELIANVDVNSLIIREAFPIKAKSFNIGTAFIS